MNPYNETNILGTLSYYLFLIIILFLIVNLFLILNYKKNGNKIENIYDYKVFLFGEHLNFFKENAKKLSFLNENIKTLMRPVINEKKMEYNSKIEEQYDKLEKIEDDIDKLSRDMMNNNIDTIIKYSDEKKNLERMKKQNKEIIEHLEKQQEKNIKDIKQIKQNYTMRIRNYVDTMVEYMGFINKQFNMALVTPALANLTEPLKKLFLSIGNGLIENSDFIKDYYPKFNMNKVPTRIDSVVDGPQDLTAVEPKAFKDKPPP